MDCLVCGFSSEGAHPCPACGSDAIQEETTDTELSVCEDEPIHRDFQLEENPPNAKTPDVGDGDLDHPVEKIEIPFGIQDAPYNSKNEELPFGLDSAPMQE